MSVVLIADDSMFQRFFIKKIVAEAGHTPLEAATGRELLDQALAQAPRLIIMDLNMPELSGQEVLETLRDKGTAITTAVVTADIQHTTKARCLELGAVEVLHKPVDETALRGLLSRLLPTA
jgi:twitching motility two-component system response regulator PilH